MNTIYIGTRGSKLALWQAEYIQQLLRNNHPGMKIELRIFSTRGDEIQDRPLPEIGGKGLFTEELEKALLKEDIHIAVHSLKDMPSSLPDGLEISGTPEREDPRDAFISLKWNEFDELPEKPKIGSGSVRRRAQIRSQRPQVDFMDLRGNIDTRLRKLEENGWDGIIMAAAALNRLAIADRITSHLDPTVFVPSVGQGAVCVETKSSREDITAIVKSINHQDTFTAVTAERSFMARLEGGCSVPMGAWARFEEGDLYLTGYFSDLTGRNVIRRTITDPGSTATELGLSLADEFEKLDFKALVSE